MLPESTLSVRANGMSRVVDLQDVASRLFPLITIRGKAELAVLLVCRYVPNPPHCNQPYRESVIVPMATPAAH